MDLQNRLARLDEELAFYHPDGGWQFLKERLDLIGAGALEALVFCPKEEIDRYRERLKLVRHLVALPEQLTEERAQLQEKLDEYRESV